MPGWDYFTLLRYYLAGIGLIQQNRISGHRLGDVFDLLGSDIPEPQFDLVLDFFVDFAGDADATGIGQRFK